MQRFLVDQHGNAQARAFHGPSLQRVDEFHRLGGRAPAVARSAGRFAHAGNAALVRWAGQGPDAVGEVPARLCRVEAEATQHIALAAPDGAHLGHLFGQGHALQQIGDPRGNRCAGILVKRPCRREGGRGESGGKGRKARAPCQFQSGAAIHINSLPSVSLPSGPANWGPS